MSPYVLAVEVLVDMLDVDVDGLLQRRAQAPSSELTRARRVGWEWESMVITA